jgi:hypothetical protein
VSTVISKAKPSPSSGGLPTAAASGSPTSTSSSDDALAWSGEKVHISVDRYSGRTGGAARLTTVAEMKESKRLRDEQTKGAAKGL